MITNALCEAPWCVCGGDARPGEPITLSRRMDKWLSVLKNIYSHPSFIYLGDDIVIITYNDACIRKRTACINMDFIINRIYRCAITSLPHLRKRSQITVHLTIRTVLSQSAGANYCS